MNCKDFKYAIRTVNMNVVEQFDGNVNEQTILTSILSEWNSCLSISELCQNWKKRDL
jgi:hypothetical protein